MPRRSNRFQRLFYQIQMSLSDNNAKVEESAEVWNDVSGRTDEIDVLITFKNSAHEFVVGVQCRDHSRPAGPSWIRDLKQQREDCRLDKMVAVHSKGFTKSAQKAAEKHNIGIMLLGAAEKSDWTQFRPSRLRINIPARVTRIELLPKFDLPKSITESMLREAFVGCKTHRCRLGTVSELVSRVLHSSDFQRQVRQMTHENAGWATLLVDWPFPNHYLCVRHQHFEFNLMRLHVQCADADVPVKWESHLIKGKDCRTVDELVAEIGDREMRIVFPDQLRSKKLALDVKQKPRRPHRGEAKWFELNDIWHRSRNAERGGK